MFEQEDLPRGRINSFLLLSFLLNSLLLLLKPFNFLLFWQILLTFSIKTLLANSFSGRVQNLDINAFMGGGSLAKGRADYLKGRKEQ